MVHKSGHTEAVDDRVTIIHGKEIRHLGISVHAFTGFSGKPRASIFKDVSAFLQGSGGVNSGAV
jgi:hypothetical protein